MSSQVQTDNWDMVVAKPQPREKDEKNSQEKRKTGRRPKWSASLAKPIAQPDWDLLAIESVIRNQIKQKNRFSTKVRQKIGQDDPVHVLEIIEVLRDCDQSGGNDCGVHD